MCISQARNKPADGSGHLHQKSGQQQGKGCQGAGGKGAPPNKPSAQKGQVKTAPPKAAAATKSNRKHKKKQQHDLHVTIDLVSIINLYV